MLPAGYQFQSETVRTSKAADVVEVLDARGLAVTNEQTSRCDADQCATLTNGNSQMIPRFVGRLRDAAVSDSGCGRVGMRPCRDAAVSGCGRVGMPPCPTRDAAVCNQNVQVGVVSTWVSSRRATARGRGPFSLLELKKVGLLNTILLDTSKGCARSGSRVSS
jgi:hypothetical protein